MESVEAFTGLGPKRGTDGNIFLSKSLPEVMVTWFLEHNFCCDDGEYAVAQFQAKVQLPLTNDFDEPATSPGFCFVVNGKA